MSVTLLLSEQGCVVVDVLDWKKGSVRLRASSLCNYYLPRPLRFHRGLRVDYTSVPALYAFAWILVINERRVEELYRRSPGTLS